MKLLLPLVLAATTAFAGAAHAATYSSDAERRTQNREEALTKWRAANGSLADRSTTSRSTQKASLGERTRDGARSAKNFTGRQVDKVRTFGERTDQRLDKRFPKRSTGNVNTDGGGGK